MGVRFSSKPLFGEADSTWVTEFQEIESVDWLQIFLTKRILSDHEFFSPLPVVLCCTCAGLCLAAAGLFDSRALSLKSIDCDEHGKGPKLPTV